MADVQLPTYSDLLLPTLQAVEEVGGAAPYQTVDQRALELAGVTEAQLSIVYPPESVQAGPKVLHRVAWARSLLKRLGALKGVSRGVWGITDKGRQYLDLPADEAEAALRSAVSAAVEGIEPSESVVSAWRASAEAGKPVSMTARELIAQWGVNRRWASTSKRIVDRLADAGLTTDPDFTVFGLDQGISIVVDETTVQTEKPDGTAEFVTLTVANLPSASAGVVAVKPGDSLIKAQSLMQANDYAQLGVMETAWKLVGAISWDSIARARLKLPSAELMQCIITDPAIVRGDAALLDVVPQIVNANFVFVRSADNRIAGIVTTADLSEQFAALARPFLLVGEIEQWLRNAVDARFSPEQLTEFVDPDAADRDVEGAHSLSLGEIQYMLQTPEAWPMMGWPADQKVFIETLDEVRILRNGIMHFSPDPLDDTDISRLLNFLVWLRSLVDEA